MIGLPLGILYSNAWEWVIHKYVLHGQGKDRSNFWSFHWHDHHKHARREGMGDHQYERSVFGWHGQGKEALGLAFATLVHLPLAKRYPWFAAGCVLSHWNYYRVHKRAHRDPQWAREHLPWHYDHHMGPNQHANWCVTRAACSATGTTTASTSARTATRSGRASTCPGTTTTTWVPTSTPIGA